LKLPAPRIKPSIWRLSTMTVIGLGLSDRLQRSLATTNAAEI
jgi:hypothetical protein